jgi:hypothetical protein
MTMLHVIDEAVDMAIRILETPSINDNQLGVYLKLIYVLLTHVTLKDEEGADEADEVCGQFESVGMLRRVNIPGCRQANQQHGLFPDIPQPQANDCDVSGDQTRLAFPRSNSGAMQRFRSQLLRTS